MRLPKKIKVGAYTYDVKYKPKVMLKNKELWGYCDRDNHEIYLRRNMPNDRKKEVLLHECLHAIEESYGINLGETKVNLLALALLALIQDNNLSFNV